MSGRAILDACIKEIEDSLGVPPKANHGADTAAGTKAASLSGAQLLDRAIADLEASLSLRPGESTPLDKSRPDKTRPDGTERASGKNDGAGKWQGEKEKAGGSAPSRPDKGGAAADQPDWPKIDLRAGLITKVWKHATAEKLYCEEIDVGEDRPRQVASDLMPHYSLEEMKGRRVVVMCSIKPRNLKGFKSQGMMVCAATRLGDDGEEKVELVMPPAEAAVGEALVFDGVDGGPFEPVTAAQMEKKNILNKILPDLATDNDGAIQWKGHKLVSRSGSPCIAATVRNGVVR